MFLLLKGIKGKDLQCSCLIKDFKWLFLLFLWGLFVCLGGFFGLFCLFAFYFSDFQYRNFCFYLRSEYGKWFSRTAVFFDFVFCFRRKLHFNVIQLLKKETRGGKGNKQELNCLGESRSYRAREPAARSARGHRPLRTRGLRARPPRGLQRPSETQGYTNLQGVRQIDDILHEHRTLIKFQLQVKNA